MEISGNKQKFGGMVINWITIFAQIAVSLFFIPFFLGTVGDKQYGLYSFSTSVIAWIDTLMVAVGSAYYKFLTREKRDHGEFGEARALGVFWKIFLLISVSILVVGLGFDVLLYTKAIPLNEYSLSEKNQICLIVMMSVISTAISCFLVTRKSYHFYKQKYILIYSFALLQLLLQAGLSFLLLKLGYGVIAVAAVHFGVSIICTVALSIISKVFLKEKVIRRPASPEDKQYRKKLFKEIIIFSSFVIINVVVDTMNKTLDKTILGFYNADSVATYQLAYSLPAYLISFTSIISIVFDQHLNEVYYNGNGVKGMNEVFLKVSKIQTIFTFLIVGGFVACGKEFVRLWIGSGREQVYIVACILMATYSITCCNRLAIIARRVQNFHIKASFIYLGIMCFNIVLSLILVNIVPREDAIWACVVGTSVTYLIGHWAVMQIYDKRVTHLDMNSFFKTFVMYLLVAGTIDLLVIKSFDLIGINGILLNFILKGGIFAIAYLAVILIFDRPFVVMLFKALRKRKTQQN